MDDCGLDFDNDDDWFGLDDKPKKRVPTLDDMAVRAIRTRQRHTTRRASSEQAMNSALDWHLTEGFTYHCISAGDVDSLTYLRGIVKQQKLEYCLLSTWCMAMTDAEEIGTWVERGDVKRMDFYVGEIFQNSYCDVFIRLEEIARSCGGRVCVARNHSKVMAGFGKEFPFAIASSANVNTNPRIENTTITCDREVMTFYKKFFDDLTPFNDGWEDWQPYI